MPAVGYGSTWNESISAEPLPKAVGTEIRQSKYITVLGSGTSQTSISSACEDMYLMPRSPGRKPEMGKLHPAHRSRAGIPFWLFAFNAHLLFGQQHNVKTKLTVEYRYRFIADFQVGAF
jgi:hypothetical protein